MPTYALLQNNKVQHVFVADSVDSLGEAGLIYDVVEVDSIYPRPGVGHVLTDGVWSAPRQTGEVTTISGLTIDDLVVPQDTPALESKGKSK